VDLSPGESATFTGSYALSQADIDAIYLDNVIDNVASATGQDPTTRMSPATRIRHRSR